MPEPFVIHTLLQGCAEVSGAVGRYQVKFAQAQDKLAHVKP
jgi:hypothetical protein